MRRVVTGVVEGKSVFLDDGPPLNSHAYKGWPGHMTSVVWATTAAPVLPIGLDTQPPEGVRVTPGPGETRLMIVRFPPDAIFADPAFDGEEYGREADVHLPGLIQAFEPDGAGMHRTDSIDYGVVLEGEIVLEVDDGVQATIRQGEMIVQGGARHAWRNPSDRDAVLLFVLIGARPVA